MRPERRRRRSRNIFVALRLWLEAAAQRSGVTGYVLTDPSGCMLASSVPRTLARELASLAPVLTHPDAGSWLRANTFSTPITVRELPTLGGRLLLCAVGRRTPAEHEAALDEAAVGVRRIMRELAGGAVWAVL